MRTSRAGSSGSRRFIYSALDPSGRTLTGEETAASKAAVRDLLDARGLFALEIGDAVRVNSGSTTWMGRGAQVAQTIRFLAVLLDAGFSIDRALWVARDSCARSDVEEALAHLRQEVRSGRKLADAMAERPRCFSRLLVGITRAGEESGTLAVAFDRVAEHLEQHLALRERLLSSLMYPAVMAIAGAATLTILLIFVLPRFGGMLTDAGIPLPRSTVLLMGFGGAVGRYWALILAVLAAAALILQRLQHHEPFVSWVHTALLTAPLIGPLRQRLAGVQLGRSLGALLESGTPILPALETTIESVADHSVRDALGRALDRVRAGSRLTDAVEGTLRLPSSFIHMMNVGEESGRLAELLQRAAGIMEDELGRRLERLVQLVEPAMILLFGAAVGLVALALLQAIYGVSAAGL